MARFNLYGASPSELAQQQGRYENFFTNAAESNRAAAERAAQFNITAQERADAIAQGAAERDYANRLNLWRYKQQDDATARGERYNLAKYGDSMAAQNRAERFDREKFDTGRELDTRKLEIAAQKESPVAESRRKFEYKMAEKDATDGVFDDAAHVLKLYPSLSPDDAIPLAKLSQDVRPQMKNNLTRFQDAADVLNRKSVLDYYIQNEKDLVKESPTRSMLKPWTWGAPQFEGEAAAGRMKGWQSEIGDASDPTSLYSRSAMLKQDPEILAAVRPDARTGRYVAPLSPSWAGTANIPDLSAYRGGGAGGSWDSSTDSSLGPPAISSKLEFDALPKNSNFVWLYPDGTRKRGTK